MEEEEKQQVQAYYVNEVDASSMRVEPAPRVRVGVTKIPVRQLGGFMRSKSEAYKFLSIEGTIRSMIM